MDSAPDMKSIVFVIDDDASVREAMHLLFKSVGLHAEVFASTAEFLQASLRMSLAVSYWMSG